MKELQKLCEEIRLQDEVKEAVSEYEKLLEKSEVQASMKKLFIEETWDQGREELKSFFKEDSDGLKMLTCMLASALETWKQYEKLGISRRIFVNTFGCFTRFVQENKDGYGRYEFDRDFWATRQLSMKIFRIGQMEYELVEKAGERWLNLHIPSDAGIGEKLVRESLEEARAFMKEYFPEYGDVPVKCDSWLLAPNLCKVLPETSNILKFQALFHMDKVVEEDKSFLFWVFKREDLPYDQLPETTSLQRNLKKFILSGGQVGVGYGTLKI